MQDTRYISAFLADHLNEDTEYLLQYLDEEHEKPGTYKPLVVSLISNVVMARGLRSTGFVEIAERLEGQVFDLLTA